MPRLRGLKQGPEKAETPKFLPRIPMPRLRGLKLDFEGEKVTFSSPPYTHAPFEGIETYFKSDF